MNLRRRLPSIWRNRDFLLFWGGQTLSGLGSSMSGLAFPLLILALTHSPALAGVAGMLRAAPFALLGPFVGALVDRWDAKRAMLWADAGRAIALGSIPFAWWAGHLSLGQLYVVTTVEGALLVCFHTAHMAALPRLAPAEQLAAASAQEESAYYATALLGPPIGGALFSLGRALPFLADALSYVLSVLSLLLLRTDLRRPTEVASAPLLTDVREGVAWLWRSPLLRALALLDIPETLVTSGLGLLVVVLAQRQQAGPAAIGAVFAVAGCGGVAGAVASAWLSRHLRLGPTLLAVRWVAVVLWPLYLLAPNPLALGAVTAVLYALNPLKNVAVVSATVPRIPERLRARVVALWDLLPALTASLGAALMGLALQYAGPSAAVLAAAAIMLLLALVASGTAAIRAAPLENGRSAGDQQATGGAAHCHITPAVAAHKVPRAPDGAGDP